MSARSLLLTLVALSAALASEPFHAWLHAEHGVEWSGHREIHGGDCEHQPEHQAHDDCLLCANGHGSSVTPPRPAACDAPATCVTTPPADAPSLRPTLALGSLGARGPPVRG